MASQSHSNNDDPMDCSDTEDDGDIEIYGEKSLREGLFTISGAIIYPTDSHVQGFETALEEDSTIRMMGKHRAEIITQSAMSRPNRLPSDHKLSIEEVEVQLAGVLGPCPEQMNDSFVPMVTYGNFSDPIVCGWVSSSVLGATPAILRNLLSYNLWSDCLTSDERLQLLPFLPKLPDSLPDQPSKLSANTHSVWNDYCVHQLLLGNTHHFDSPLIRFVSALSNGHFTLGVSTALDRLSMIRRRQHVLTVRDYHNELVYNLQSEIYSRMLSRGKRSRSGGCVDDMSNWHSGLSTGKSTKMRPAVCSLPFSSSSIAPADVLLKSSKGLSYEKSYLSLCLIKAIRGAFLSSSACAATLDYIVREARTVVLAIYRTSSSECPPQAVARVVVLALRLLCSVDLVNIALHPALSTPLKRPFTYPDLRRGLWLWLEPLPDTVPLDYLDRLESSFLKSLPCLSQLRDAAGLTSYVRGEIVASSSVNASRSVGENRISQTGNSFSGTINERGVSRGIKRGVRHGGRGIFTGVDVEPSMSTAIPQTCTQYLADEVQRYSNPNECFFYTNVEGLSSIVGPVKRRVTTQRHHLLLKSDRPLLCTLLNLTRDAVARLPRSGGKCGDICALVRQSAHVNADIKDDLLSAEVNKVLHSLQDEEDPCCHFDHERQVWLYLHRDRTPSDFNNHETGQNVESGMNDD